MNPVDPTHPAPVAIIGMGCLFPRADGLGGYWANIRHRRDAITEVPETHWRPEDYFDPDPKAPDRTYARRGGFLSPVDFPPLDFGIAPNNLEATDTTQLLGLMVARRALEDAGYGEGSSRPLDRSRVSVILGVTGTLELVIPLGARLGHPIWRRALKAAGVADDTAEDVVRRIADSYVGWQENSFPGLLGNVAAGRIANRLDLGGTNCVVDAACASSVGALNLALLELAAGRCDLALTGGLDTFNDIFMYMCFSKTPALSPRGDARPFDAGCDGTVLGEGLGVLALKRLADARRDGDRVYAVVRAVGSSSDGKGGAVYAPRAEGQVKALREAYRLAGVSPATVELVEAHGTGTKVGDATELAALNEAYREARAEGTWCALGSVKSQIGHTKAAAGAAGLIKAALALHHKVLPPTIKVTEPIGGVGAGRSPFYLNTEARPWLPRPDHPRRAAVSAFGFGGSNFHCLLEEADPAKPGVDWDGEVQILAFSAADRDGLTAALEAFPRGLDWEGVRAEAARTRARFRPDDPHRLVAVAERHGDLEATLRRARAAARGECPAAKDGVYAGSGRPPGRLAMVFPGQGSQYVGMLRELACVFPQVQDALAEADRLGGESPARLSDQVYPFPAFNAEDSARQERALRATEAAQPAIGAVSLGLVRVLEQFGVRPDVAAGHSFGELTALCAAGWVEPGAFAALARHRGRLMAEQAAGGGGGMVAVLAPAAEVEAVLRAEGLDLVVANKNGPRQSVLSGPAEAVAKAAEAFRRRHVANRELSVSAAFHSPAVAAASGPFRDALAATAVTPTGTPVYANATGGRYPTDADAARDLLAGQIARPVEFVAQVEAMARDGVGIFLEVGPDAKLTGLIRSIVGDGDGAPAALAVDASRGARGNLVDLATALAELAALGYPVRLTRWDDGADSPPRPDRKPGLTVKVSGANPAPRPPAPRPTAPTVAPNPAPRPTPVARPAMTPPPAPTDRPEPAPVAPHANGESSTPGGNGSRHGAPPSNGAPARAATPTSGAAKGFPATTPVPLGPADPHLVAQALRTAQDNLVALQRLGEQTADLHRQFLDGQDKAQRTFQSLLEQQQRLTLASLGLVPADPLPSQPLEPSVVASASPPPRVVVREPAADPLAGRTRPAPSPPRFERETVAPPELSEPPAAPDRAGPPSAPALEILLGVVSEKTGYPAEMLDPSLSLDADLGIDSIKRVEILSALQERLPDAPPVGPDRLATLRTLQDVLDAVADATPTAAPVAAVAVRAAEALRAVLLDVVSEKTGYPAEMLDPTMTLDADLGIDSIKRDEILSALQERLPDAPPVGPDRLATLRTLQDVLDAIGQSSPAPAAPAVASKAPVMEILLGVVSEKTGYPAEMLDPAMTLDADLGIDSIKRVEILSALQERLPGAPPVGPDRLATLRTLQDVLDALAGADGRTAAVVEEIPAAPSTPVRPEPARLQRLVVGSATVAEAGGEAFAIRPGGEVWVTDDGSGLAAGVVARLAQTGHAARLVSWDAVGSTAAPTRLDGLVLVAPPAGAGDRFVADAFRWLRLAGPALRRAGRESGAIAATVARLDGAFGAAGLADGTDPAFGGLAGLVKTAGHEWPDVLCKALDVDPDSGDAEAAAAVVDELFRRGPAEVGLSGHGRTTPELVPSAVAAASGPPPFAPGDLVIVTGGARGVTAEAAVALAEAFRPTLVLLGRSPAPEAEPDWLAALEGEAEIKRALAARANGHATPQLVGERFRRLAADREIRRTVARIEAAGARAAYRAVDLRDAAAVAAVVGSLRTEFGPVRGIIHGAGVLADRRIEDQTDAQFAEVYDTKVAGLRAMLDAVGTDDLKALVLFSSSTARFGRTGQVAYAAANEVVNKVARRESNRRPGCRVVAVNWGPWDGGMVTPSLKPLFAAEGIGLIPLAEGARYLVDEVAAAEPDRPVEVVVLGGDSLPATLGTAPPPTGAPAPAPKQPARQAALTTAFELRLDVDALPVLRSHVIDGRAVLPMALILEWLAHGAIQRNPGLSFCGVDDLRVLKGVVLHDDGPETVAVLVGKATRGEGLFRVPVELRGTAAGGKTVAHTRGEVVLADRPARPDRPTPDTTGFPPSILSPRSVYHDVLFHGPDLQGLERIEALGPDGAVAVARTAPGPAQWVEQPPRQAWLTDPLAIDCAFQLLSLWCFEQAGAASLPTNLGRYRQYRRSFPAPRVRVAARVTRPAPHRAAAEIAFLDADGQTVARVDGYECVLDASLNQAFRRNRLLRVARSPR